jgi:hypothetical protein
MQKRMIIPALALVVSTGLLYGGTRASAFEPSTMRGTLVSRLAERFQRSEAEVEQVLDEVFDEVRLERGSELSVRLEKRLDTAVEAGILTGEQRELILEKHQEMREQRLADREAQAHFTSEERRAEMQAVRDELESWAEENDIDLQYFARPGMKGFAGRVMKSGSGGDEHQMGQ